MKKILVSACLYGEICRYDAKQCGLSDEIFLDLKKQGLLIPICPEVCGGLETPRVPCEICDGRVINKIGEDKTTEFEKGAKEALRIAKENDVCCCILKSRSPSCGAGVIYDGTFSGKRINGYGVTAKLLKDNGFFIFSEETLNEAAEFLKKSKI